MPTALPAPAYIDGSSIVGAGTSGDPAKIHVHVNNTNLDGNGTTGDPLLLKANIDIAGDLQIGGRDDSTVFKVRKANGTEFLVQAQPSSVGGWLLDVMTDDPDVDAPIVLFSNQPHLSLGARYLAFYNADDQTITTRIGDHFPGSPYDTSLPNFGNFQGKGISWFGYPVGFNGQQNPLYTIDILSDETNMTCDDIKINIIWSGGMDTTAGDLTATNIRSLCNATRNQGGNNLKNRSIFADAVNGQINEAIRVGRGDVIVGFEEDDAPTAAKVGIGTMAPARRFHVYGASTADGSARSVAAFDADTAYGSSPEAGIAFGVKTDATTITRGATIQAYKENATSGHTGMGFRIITKADGSNPAVAVDVDPNGKLSMLGDAAIGGLGAAVGFMGATPLAKQTVSGSRGGNAALQSLLEALHETGLIYNATT